MGRPVARRQARPSARDPIEIKSINPIRPISRPAHRLQPCLANGSPASRLAGRREGSMMTTVFSIIFYFLGPDPDGPLVLPSARQPHSPPNKMPRCLRTPTRYPALARWCRFIHSSLPGPRGAQLAAACAGGLQDTRPHPHRPPQIGKSSPCMHDRPTCCQIRNGSPPKAALVGGKGPAPRSTMCLSRGPTAPTCSPGQPPTANRQSPMADGNQSRVALLRESLVDAYHVQNTAAGEPPRDMPARLAAYLTTKHSHCFVIAGATRAPRRRG